MEKIFEKPELLVFNGSRYSKGIITCTKCGHIEFNSELYRFCPNCKTDFALTDLRKAHFYSNTSLTCYSTINYGYIEKITLIDRHFSIIYRLYTTEIFGAENIEDIKYTTKEDVLEFIIQDEKLKTKEVYNTRTRLYLNGSEIKVTISNLSEYFSTCINGHELIALGICEPAHSLYVMLKNFISNFKTHRKHIEIGLGSISGKNKYSKLISMMESSEYYFNLILTEVNKKIKENVEDYKKDSWIYALSESKLMDKFPCIEKEYYDIYNRISNMNTYYTEDLKDLKYLNDYHYKHLALLFFNYKYTEEEQDLFLQMMYKQAFPCSKIATLISHLKCIEDLELPFVKLPKELEIYTERLIKISSYIQREMLSSYKELNILDNKYTLMVNNNKETAIKALSYNNNFTLLNKILYDYNYNYKNNSVSLVKNTDYIIVYSLIKTNDCMNSKYVIHKIYDKDKEITDKKKIIDILDSIIKEQGGNE